MVRLLLVVAVFALAGCASQPPGPVAGDDKRFDSVPGKAVIYIVRDGFGPGLSDSLVLDEEGVITTHPKTFYRWEVAPGTHRIRGFAGSSGSITVSATAGQTYFVEHRVRGTRRAGVLSTHLQRLESAQGRDLVRSAETL